MFVQRNAPPSPNFAHSPRCLATKCDIHPIFLRLNATSKRLLFALPTAVLTAQNHVRAHLMFLLNCKTKVRLPFSQAETLALFKQSVTMATDIA